MGQPKHLMRYGPRTFLEIALEAMRPLCQELAVLGSGEVPFLSEPVHRLEDVEGLRGPAAGILAALRYDAHATWLIVACDMPRLHPEALRWLRDEHQRQAFAATMPKVSDHVLPTCAIYTHAVLRRLQDHALAGRGPRALGAEHDVHTPVPVDAAAFVNVNNAEDYATWVWD